MDENGDSDSNLPIHEGTSTSLCPMFFGVSCAFFALEFMSKPESSDEKWLEVRNKMLQGSAHLLGLLVWRVQKEEAKNVKSDLLRKLENAWREVEELKKRRSEDARANEKVVSIFASQEQCWFNERKKLRRQIGGLINELRILEAQKDNVISELNEKLQEKELLLQSKDENLKEEEAKKQQLEEKLKKAEDIAEELKDSSKREAQRHSAEITKHKTAFIELVSNHRQLEAEMARVLRQFEAAKQDVDSVLEQKEQSLLMTQKLSMELVKMRKDLEQKDQILSAMLRKSKLDTAEKQTLLQEMKLSKAKKKKAELETERWKAVSETKHERVSLKSILSKHTNFKLNGSSGGKGVHSNEAMSSYPAMTRSLQIDHLLEYEHPECRKALSAASDHYLTRRNGEITNTKQLESWVQSEAEKYRTANDQRHHLEIDAFAEQLRLKDEKLEAFRWRLLSMELESKRLQTHIEGLNHDMAQLRQDNMELEALLLNREEELRTLREELVLQLSSPNCQTTNLNPSLHDPAIVPDLLWSKVKIIKRKPGQKEQEMKQTDAEICPDIVKDRDETPTNNQPKDIILTLHSPEKNIEPGKAQESGPDSFQEECSESDCVKDAESSSSVSECVGKNSNSAWKMDLHALGVSYKIKRLKQQLIMLERLTGKQENSEISESNDNKVPGRKGFYALLSLLNKQIGRYQSLQGKIDDLCKRMHNHDLDLNCKSTKIARTDDETKMLEHFLEETFQLQRYIVATGQKLMEVQAKIASGFTGTLEAVDRPASFDVKRFADSVRTLFGEVQRGLEVRIARSIGDLGGTLASDGIVHMRR